MAGAYESEAFGHESDLNDLERDLRALLDALGPAVRVELLQSSCDLTSTG